MKRGFCPLASGSKGNAIFFGSDECKILVDAGISGRATKKKLAEIDVPIEEIDAILITHDHSDHIQGLKALALKYDIPILANVETAKGIYAQLKAAPCFQLFTTGEPFHFKDLTIHPFSIQHDTPDPVAFTIETGGVKVGLCADLGFATSLVKRQLQGCDYLYIEANHEPHMVHASSRPMIYKQRVLSRSGHLSNEACADLLEEIVHDELKHIHLAHLSSECNSPQTALDCAKERLHTLGRKIEISIAPQDTIGHAIEF